MDEVGKQDQGSPSPEGSTPSGPRRSKRKKPEPAFISGTSAEFLGRKPLPRAVRSRPVLLILGPGGVGKTTVAERLLGEGTLSLSDKELLERIANRVRTRRWDPELLESAALILEGPCFLDQRPGLAQTLATLLKARIEAGRRTVLIEAPDGSLLRGLTDKVDPDDRATILLRFPEGRGRRRFALLVCEELSLPAELARAVVEIEPWTYATARALLLESVGGARRP
jgi:hypothetical protein